MPVLQPAVLKGKTKVRLHNLRAFSTAMHHDGAPKQCVTAASRVSSLFCLKNGDKTISG
ncbi:hypothetical protein VWV82_000665 [Cronobacter malonaticus]|uniref:hypothetical protein n=1 Tax=Cronobacter malonaticus TaxID=413503 RepID=UPI0012D32773|nr:hypothetical protein [Cronobacter malonaticus]EKP4389617.1 hypothetical protein [Cronobacter malonaticus]EKY3230884.1 hypothetical protein [Cronobacter malonaticus]ELY2514353.1 hypothetical protein [Cronobacter malonaticus]ELY2767785.1 hypothetical protein [Cronobacter malonaticus]ELY4026256.1 hypothetical protein [Cronobacter malonaticus]